MVTTATVRCGPWSQLFSGRVRHHRNAERRQILKREKIVSIHYLRGLCALLVVIAHLSYLLPGRIIDRIPGAIGVDIFFMISGFIMILVTRDGAESPGAFIVKRFFRIYPVFFVVWLLSVLAIYRDAGPARALCSLALCLEDYASQGPEFGFNLLGPPWTLTYEMYFYVLFCCAMALSRKWRGPVCALLIVALTVGLQLAANGTFALSSQASALFQPMRWWDVPLKILSNTIFYEFVFGMLVATVIERLPGGNGGGVVGRLAGAVLALATLAAFAKGPVPFGMSGGFWFAAPIFAAAVLLGAYVRLPAIRPLAFLGDISYSLYLVHFSLMSFVQQFLPAGIGLAGNLAIFGALLAGSLLLSFGLYRTIELPAIRLGRSMASRCFPRVG